MKSVKKKPKVSAHQKAIERMETEVLRALSHVERLKMLHERLHAKK